MAQACQLFSILARLSLWCIRFLQYRQRSENPGVYIPLFLDWFGLIAHQLFSDETVTLTECICMSKSHERSWVLLCVPTLCGEDTVQLIFLLCPQSWCPTCPSLDPNSIWHINHQKLKIDTSEGKSQFSQLILTRLLLYFLHFNCTKCQDFLVNK